MALGGKVFTAKGYGVNLYKWSPQSSDKKGGARISKAGKFQKPYFCNALPGSQGEDWITTYTYNIVILNGLQQRIAYVACDYVA